MDFDVIRRKSPLIHCITNYVTANDLADALLSLGARVVMTDDFEDAQMITERASALYVNLGTLRRDCVEAIMHCSKLANEMRKPLVLDPAGIPGTNYRKSVCDELLHSYKFDLIKGNYAEMRYLMTREISGIGVDNILLADIGKRTDLAREISLKFGATAVVTGECDVISDGRDSYAVRNGTDRFARITGGGCMLGGFLAAVLSSFGKSDAAFVAEAVSVWGILGEKAESLSGELQGNATFKLNLIDLISQLKTLNVDGEMKIEKV